MCIRDSSGLFFENTKINGYDVTGKTAKEVMLILERDYSAPELTINEGGQEALTLTLEDMGCLLYTSCRHRLRYLPYESEQPENFLCKV